MECSISILVQKKKENHFRILELYFDVLYPKQKKNYVNIFCKGKSTVSHFSHRNNKYVFRKCRF